MADNQRQERTQERMPNEQQLEIKATDFLPIANGKAVLMAILRDTQVVEKVSISHQIEEQDLIDLCSAMKGGTSVKCIEIEYIGLSTRAMAAIASVTSLSTFRFRPCDRPDEETCEGLANMVQSSRNLTVLELGNQIFGRYGHLGRALDRTLAMNSTLTHLRLGLLCQGPVRMYAPSAIASLLGTNTTLEELHIEENRFPREGLVEIESILKYVNTTLTNLTIRTRDYYDDIEAQCRPYL